MVAAIGTYCSLVEVAELEDIEAHLVLLEESKEKEELKKGRDILVV